MWQISSIAYLPHRYLFLSKTNIFYGRQKFEISVAASQQVAQRMENIMPIKTQSDLPAKEILEKENIFVMDESRATHQDIRVIEIGILNLMPLKEDTELQLLRSLSNTPLQINVTFITVSSHESKNTSMSHLNKFYETFADIKNRYFDGLIITGAPVEQMEYEEVDYWKEMCEIFEWSKTHATSTLHLCWGAQAGQIGRAHV